MLLGGTLLFCLLLLTVQARSQSSAAADALAALAAPIQTALARAGYFAVGLWSTYRGWRDVRAENVRLRDEIASAAHRHAPGGRDRRRESPTASPPLPAGALARSPRWPARSSPASGAGGCGRSPSARGPPGRRQAADGRHHHRGPGGARGRGPAGHRDRAGADRSRLHRRRPRGQHAHGRHRRGAGARARMRFKFMARDGAGLKVGDLVVTSGVGRAHPARASPSGGSRPSTIGARRSSTSPP